MASKNTPTEIPIGILRQCETNETFPVRIVPQQTLRLKRLVSFNGYFEISYEEGRIGDDKLLPIEGPIDLAYFNKHHYFEYGTIDPDNPLCLYVKVFGTPSIMPYINFVIVGETDEKESQEDRKESYEETASS